MPPSAGSRALFPEPAKRLVEHYSATVRVAWIGFTLRRSPPRWTSAMLASGSINAALAGLTLKLGMVHLIVQMVMNHAIQNDESLVSFKRSQAAKPFACLKVLANLAG